ncbi:MAG: hydroxyethylthiazole kinase [Eubacteriales bacterium]|nr:hydroxyethylthiazole kinase [Eubacteriales bacterium]MDD4390274.1 hydroxyethylthiazole kinase [Eubacteriales bacterium]
MGNKENIQNQIIQAVDAVKKTTPMAPSITNTVTINFVANAQLAVGGSAAMVYMPDEGEALAKAANSFYINVGTIFPNYEETLPATAKALHESRKPWVLDPVAVGLGGLRTKLLIGFKEYKPSIIRGNASEIITLAGLWGLDDIKYQSTAKGVDSTDSVNSARQAAIALARYTGGAVAVSGEVDLITDGSVIALSYGGSHFMEKITGSGCSLGGVAAVYATAATPFIAALTASAVYNLAGKRAEALTVAPGSFQVTFIDELYKATAQDIAENKFELEEV